MQSALSLMKLAGVASLCLLGCLNAVRTYRSSEKSGRSRDVANSGFQGSCGQPDLCSVGIVNVTVSLASRLLATASHFHS